MGVKQLKESEDEQIIADIAASVLKDEPLPASKELLDKLYDGTTEDSKELERRLAVYNADGLSREIKSTFSVLRQVVEDCSRTASFLRSTVRPGTFYPIKAPFYAIFMAFFDLIVRQEKSPDQPRRIMAALEGLDSKLTKGAHYETTENRRSNIGLTKGLIQDYFVDKVPPVLGHGPSLVIDFENALRRSRIETARYEFKQGVLRLDESRSLDSDLLARLPQTACGIANLGPDSEGFLFIGVADRESHADRVQMLDRVEPRKIGDHFLVGVEREAALLGISLDEYVNQLVTAFQNSDLGEPLRSQLVASFDTVTLHNLTAIRIVVPRQEDVSFVGDQAFSREGSSTIAVEGPRLLAVSKLFKRE